MKNISCSASTMDFSRLEAVANILCAQRPQRLAGWLAGWPDDDLQLPNPAGVP